MFLVTLVWSAMFSADPLGPGSRMGTLEVGGLTRSYVLHIPPKYDPKRPTPLVLAFHGAAASAPIMELASGLSAKSDEAGFVVVYPNSTSQMGLVSAWNSGGFRGPNHDQWPDDVAFVKALLDHLATVVNVDSRRVYATGISNGGMMCYRLAAELSERIAAIAPVSGTMAIAEARPRRPVPVIHFHGTVDRLVPHDGPDERIARFLTFKSVEETIHIWARLNGCPRKPKTAALPDTAKDGTTVRREVYGPGREGAEVVLYVIEGGGHTWPGRGWPVPFLGKTTLDISANDLIWEFFQRHPMRP